MLYSRIQISPFEFTYMVSLKYREAGKHGGRADLVCGAASSSGKLCAMPSGRLQQFHGASIEVEVEVQGALAGSRGQGATMTTIPTSARC